MSSRVPVKSARIENGGKLVHVPTVIGMIVDKSKSKTRLESRLLDRRAGRVWAHRRPGYLTV